MCARQVRWADFEARSHAASARERGFVLGQTDWTSMTDPSCGSSALVQVRYIEPRDQTSTGPPAAGTAATAKWQSAETEQKVTGETVPSTDK